MAQVAVGGTAGAGAVRKDDQRCQTLAARGFDEGGDALQTQLDGDRFAVDKVRLIGASRFRMI